MRFTSDGNPIADHVKDIIIDKIDDLSRLFYDHGGNKELPMRGDILAFSRFLFSGDRSNSRGINANYLERAGEPDVSLNVDGTVDLFFQNRSRELNLTIQCGGVIAYVQCLDDGDTTIEGTIRIWSRTGDCGEVDDLLQWVHKG